MPVENRPSQDPRDEAIRAATRDAATIAGLLDHTIRATYRGSLRAEYIRVLGTYIEDIRGTLEPVADHLVATVGEQRIVVGFR